MRKFYVSLVRGLLGYYVMFEAKSEQIVREHLAKYFGQMWCSIYKEEDFPNVRGVKKVVNDKPIVLETPEWE